VVLPALVVASYTNTSYRYVGASRHTKECLFATVAVAEFEAYAVASKKVF
jgi:hypothetical protein